MRILKAYQVAHGLTQAQVGHKLDLEVSMISLLLRGKRRPSLETLQKIAALTGVSLDALSADLQATRRKRVPTAQDLEQIAQVMK